MGKKWLILIVCVIATMIVGCIGFAKYMSGGRMLTDSTKGYIKVKCDRARAEGGGGVSIRVSEGEKLIVESKISKGAITLKLNRIDGKENTLKDIISSIGENTEFEINEEFSGNQTRELEVLPGKYSGWCQTKGITTGTLKAYTK